MTELSIKRITSASSFAAAKLRAYWNPLWKIMTLSLADEAISHRKDICVSIEKARLSVAYGTVFLSRNRVIGFKSYPFEDRYPQPDDIASTVSLAVNEIKAVGGDITLSIPKAWAIVKIAEFPSVVKQNLPDVVSYELDRLTPFGPEDAYYDFRVLREEGNKIYLLIIAAKADLINPYISALKGKGFNVKRLTINLSGIGILCRQTSRGDDLIFLDISEKEYEGAVFDKGSVMAVFTGSFPASDERSKADVIMKETEPFIEGLKKQGRSPNVIVSNKDKGAFNELLKLRMNLPVKTLSEVANAGSNISGTQKDIAFSAVGGVFESLTSKTVKLNMLSKGRQEILKTPTRLTIALLFLIIILLFFYIIAPLRIEEERLKGIDRQIMLRKDDVRKTEAIKKEADTLNGEISTINNFKENRPMALNIIKELTAILPKTAWLSRLRITTNTVEIEGYAASATELLPKLEAAKYFKKAEFASPTFRDARQNADRFNIKVEIESAKQEGTGSPDKQAPKTTGLLGAPSQGANSAGLSGKKETTAPRPMTKNEKK